MEIAQQLQVVEEAKKTLIHDHIDPCIERTVRPMVRESRAPIDEFKEISKYL